MMDRETEMYHAAIKILSNRADQYDELEHAVDNSELLKKKERMLNQSKWERNKRTKHIGKYGTASYRYDNDPDIVSEAGKHGYVDTNDGRIGISDRRRSFNGNLSRYNYTGYSDMMEKKIADYLEKYYDEKTIKHRIDVLGESIYDLKDDIVNKIYKNIPETKEYGKGNFNRYGLDVPYIVDVYVKKIVK